MMNKKEKNRFERVFFLEGDDDSIFEFSDEENKKIKKKSEKIIKNLKENHNWNLQPGRRKPRSPDETKILKKLEKIHGPKGTI